jgi:hypothetical protein
MVLRHMAKKNIAPNPAVGGNHSGGTYDPSSATKWNCAESGANFAFWLDEYIDGFVKAPAVLADRKSRITR